MSIFDTQDVCVETHRLRITCLNPSLLGGLCPQYCLFSCFAEVHSFGKGVSRGPWEIVSFCIVPTALWEEGR